MSESDKKSVKNALQTHNRFLDTRVLRKKISYRNAFGMYLHGNIFKSCDL